MATKPEIPYTTPTIHKGETTWYVEYNFWNDSTNKMERVRRTHELNRNKNSPNLKAKKDNFNQLLDFYKEELLAGYDPFDDVKTAIVKKSRVSLSLIEARDLYAESLSEVRENTKQVYLSNVDAFVAAYGAGNKISDIRGSSVNDALIRLEKSSKEGKWRNTTWNNKKVSIGTFFEFLISNKYIKENPLKDVKLRTKQTTIRHEIFTDEHLDAILKWLDVNKPMCAIFSRTIYYTCIRPNELRQLKVKHVNLAAKKITVPDYIAKNKTEGYVHIDDDSYTILEKQTVGRDKETFLFPYVYIAGLKAYESGLREKGFSRMTMYGQFVEALDALKLTGLNYTLYSLKHYSNVKKYLAGWSIAEICAANRHKSLVETETYLKALLKFAPVTKKVPAIG